MHHTNSRVRLGVAAGITAVAVTGLAAALQPAAASPGRVPLAASTPSWTAHARRAGAPAGSQHVSFGIMLRMRHADRIASDVAAVSSPSSARYRHYLTHAQFLHRYAPSASTVSAVRSWLHGDGLRVTGSMSGGLYLAVDGSAAAVEKTFATHLRDYRVHGQVLHANTARPTIAAGAPAAVRGAVAGVVGLDQGSVLAQPADQLPGPPPGGRYGVPPCSAYYAQKIATNLPPAYGKRQPYAVCGYVPAQYQGAYGETPLLKKGIDGSGVTVAITDAYASPTMRQDADTYATRHGGKAFADGQYTQILPAKFDVPDPSRAQGWYGEETLDVEAVHGMAPGAKVVYVGGSDDGLGLLQAWAHTINNHVADIISDSWTLGLTSSTDDPGPGVQKFFQTFATEAAMTGITVNFSAGDDGDESDSGPVHVDFPADQPYVTGVGGTSVLIGKNDNWEGEYGWSNAYSTLSKNTWGTPAYSSGGGGGTSTLYSQPFYQQGVVPTKFSEKNGSTPMRVVPDISMVGDPNTGFKVGETQQFADGTYYAEYRIGGTSLSSPLLAGSLALADQLAGQPLGFLNPTYYKLIGNAAALHDESRPSSPVAQVRTNFTNGVDGADGKTYLLQTIDTLSNTLVDQPGYDNETGVGSPGGPQFYYRLAAGS